MVHTIGHDVHAATAAKSLQSCPTLCDPIDSSLTGSLVPGILQARILEWVTISFSNACMHAKSLQLCPTLCDPMDTRLLRPWDFLSKNTGVGCHFLLQGVFLTQGSNPGLPHCRQTLYRLSHQGSERTCVHLLIRHFLSTLGLMLRMQRKSRKGFCPRFIFS